MIIGHRGAAGLAPENTLAGIRAAASVGVRGVEFDVRLSRDGVPVVFHDDTLDRTTDGTGRVADWDMARLTALDAGGWFAARYTGEPIPTFEQTLDLLASLRLAVNVEIKPDAPRVTETVERTLATLVQRWPEHCASPLISCFEDNALDVARRLARHLPRALLVVDIPDNWQARCARIGATALHAAAESLTPEAAQAVTDAGFALRCYTVNDPGDGQRLFDMGVNAVFSDHPERLLGTEYHNDGGPE